MNRRAFVQSAAALLTLGAAGAVPRAPRKFGVLTVEGHAIHKQVTGESLHVFVDGIDVTRDCRLADDVEGYALVYCRDEAAHRDLAARGHLHVDGLGSAACQFRLTGQVVIQPGAPL